MIPTRIGQKCLGGYFTGFTRDNTTAYALVFSPAEYSAEYIRFAKGNTPLWNSSKTNGVANTQQLSQPSFIVAEHCRKLNIEGYTDWYVPSIRELELCYISFKHSWRGQVAKIPATHPAIAIPSTPNVYTADTTLVLEFTLCRAQATLNALWSSTLASNDKECFVVEFAGGWIDQDPIWFNTAEIRAVRRELVAGVE